MNPTSNDEKYRNYEKMVDDLVAEDERDLPPRKKVERQQSQWHLELPASKPIPVPTEESSEEEVNYNLYWKVSPPKLEDKE